MSKTIPTIIRSHSDKWLVPKVGGVVESYNLMSDLKLGFIGYGRHAQSNLYPALKLLGQPIQAIATTSEKSSQLGQKEQKASAAYSDYRQMLEQEELDCVVISAPPDHHARLTIDSLEAGCHVFVEKPLGMNAGDAEKVAQKSKETGKYVMVGFMKRYAPAFEKMYELVGSPEFGDLVSVHCTYGVRNFAKDVSEMLLMAAIHNVDMLRSLTGGAEILKGFSKMEGDSFVLNFNYKSNTGVIGSMSCVASPAWARLHEEYYITGTGGFVRVNNVEQLSYHFTPPVSDKPRWQIMDEEETIITTVSTTSSGGNKDLYQRGFVPELEHFLTCVRENKKPRTNAADNLETMKMVDMIIANCKI